jgi:hypothetical protein
MSSSAAGWTAEELDYSGANQAPSSRSSKYTCSAKSASLVPKIGVTCDSEGIVSPKTSPSNPA